MELKLPYAPAPENASKLAEICVETARKVSGFELDYFPASLALVEHQVERFRISGLSVDELASTLFCFGCYVGEVLVRHLGGIWVEERNSPMKGLAGWPIVTLMKNGSCWNPIGKVFRRFEEGGSESLPYFYSTAERHSRARV